MRKQYCPDFSLHFILLSSNSFGTMLCSAHTHQFSTSMQRLSAHKTIDLNVIVVYGKVFYICFCFMLFDTIAIECTRHCCSFIYLIVSYFICGFVLFYLPLLLFLWFYFLLRFFLHRNLCWKDFGTTALGYISFTPWSAEAQKAKQFPSHFSRTYFNTVIIYFRFFIRFSLAIMSIDFLFGCHFFFLL